MPYEQIKTLRKFGKSDFFKDILLHLLVDFIYSIATHSEYLRYYNCILKYLLPLYI